MSENKNSKNVGCATIVVILLIIAAIGWLFKTNIEDEKKVLDAIQGGWEIQEKNGGFFTNIKIEINGENFKAWRKMENTDKTIDDWGPPTCEGNFSLSPVQTYNNTSEKFRHINWNNCIDIHDARYDETVGMYWGEWGAMKSASRGFWYSFKWFLYLLGAGMVIISINRLVKLSNGNTEEDTTNENSKGFDAKELYLKYKFPVLSTLGVLLLLLPIFTNFRATSITDLFIGLIIYSAAPIIVFKQLKFKKTFLLLFALPIYYLTCEFGSLFYNGIGGLQSAFFYNYNDSLRETESWFFKTFYLSILFSLLLDFTEQRKPSIIPSYFKLLKFIFTPLLPLLALFIPFFLQYNIYAKTRHIITGEEEKKFISNNSYFAGEWYFLSTDSTATLKIQILPVQPGQHYNTGVLLSKFEFKLFKADEQPMGGDVLDTIIKYDTIIQLPLRYKGGSEVTSLKDSMLGFKIKVTDGSYLTFQATKNKSLMLRLIDNHNQRKQGTLSEVITDTLTLISGKCSEGDCYYSFKNGNKDETHISSKLPEKVVEFVSDPDGGVVVENKYLNKKYIIRYQNRLVHHEDSNADVMEMEILEMVPSVK